jgi:hypothetical protein
MLTDTKAKGKPYKITDCEGLYLHVTATGAKAWRFDYRLAGARETLTIGRYPEKSLADAREDLGRRLCRTEIRCAARSSAGRHERLRRNAATGPRRALQANNKREPKLPS